MGYEVVRFKREYVDDAVKLFAEAYAHQREKLPLMPVRAMEDWAWIAGEIERQDEGIAILGEGERVRAAVRRT